MGLPFEITVKIAQTNYLANISIELFAYVKSFVVRKAVQIVINRDLLIATNRAFPLCEEDLKKKFSYEIKLSEQALYRWFWTHIFYYGEANKFIRFLLHFKAREIVLGAIIKKLFNKTYIVELT